MHARPCFFFKHFFLLLKKTPWMYYLGQSILSFIRGSRSHKFLYGNFSNITGNVKRSCKHHFMNECSWFNFRFSHPSFTFESTLHTSQLTLIILFFTPNIVSTKYLDFLENQVLQIPRHVIFKRNINPKGPSLNWSDNYCKRILCIMHECFIYNFQTTF